MWTWISFEKKTRMPIAGELVFTRHPSGHPCYLQVIHGISVAVLKRHEIVRVLVPVSSYKGL